MDLGPELFNKVCNVMEQYNMGVQLGCYSISLLGLAAAVRRVKPFSRFKKASDIPNRFLKERKQLDGIVERIEPRGSVLMVKHKPLVFSLSSAGRLPVKIASIDVNENGLIWLQSVVAGNQIKFIPIVKEGDSVKCEVVLPKAITYKTQSSKYIKAENLNIGETLVAIDFAKLSETPEQRAADNLPYFTTLKNAELIALKRKLGYKYYINSMKLLLPLIMQRLQALILMASIRATALASPKRS